MSGVASVNFLVSPGPAVAASTAPGSSASPTVHSRLDSQRSVASGLRAAGLGRGSGRPTTKVEPRLESAVRIAVPRPSDSCNTPSHPHSPTQKPQPPWSFPPGFVSPVLGALRILGSAHIALPPGFPHRDRLAATRVTQHPSGGFILQMKMMTRFALPSKHAGRLHIGPSDEAPEPGRQPD
jgi:hypothetical protein